MESAFLLLGSNMGNKRAVIQEALLQLSAICGFIVSKSKNYRSKPWGFEAEDYFINMAVELKTDLDPYLLLDTILKIESKLGRTRVNDCNYHSRVIDIDIIFYGNRVIESEELVIPHPRMHLRNFVLIPINEIAPDFIHPTLKISVKDLLEQCADKCEVKQMQLLK